MLGKLIAGAFWAINLSVPGVFISLPAGRLP
jgi:hypothetical protein